MMFVFLRIASVINITPFISLSRHEDNPKPRKTDLGMTARGVRRERRRFPVGARPTRRTLQPEATGAVMEVTKWLKPSV